LVVRTVAGEALIGQYRVNVALEIDFSGGIAECREREQGGENASAQECPLVVLYQYNSGRARYNWTMHASDLITHVRYNAWASRRALDMARALGREEAERDLNSSHRSVLGTLAHVFIADRVWWSRIQGSSPATLTGPGEEFSIEKLDAEWLPLLDRYISWAEALEPQGWERAVFYATTAGVKDQRLVRHIILHLVNHDSIHRGQVAAMIRQLGRAAVSTDLIEYYRTAGSAASA
jgi:uncharacterized damage-inducible protein DinB